MATVRKPLWCSAGHGWDSSLSFHDFAFWEEGSTLLRNGLTEGEGTFLCAKSGRAESPPGNPHLGIPTSVRSRGRPRLTGNFWLRLSNGKKRAAPLSFCRLVLGGGNNRFHEATMKSTWDSRSNDSCILDARAHARGRINTRLALHFHGRTFQLQPQHPKNTTNQNTAHFFGEGN